MRVGRHSAIKAKMPADMSVKWEGVYILIHILVFPDYFFKSVSDFKSRAEQ